MVDVSHYWILDNGLRVNFICCPQSAQSAALLLVGAGSHQEPTQWPGLAHLTEHLLFAGGSGFQGTQRLMPWLMQRNGRVNATTRLNSTSYYFQLAPEELAGGVLRLLDMALFPVIDRHRVARECEVIDAEFQLLSADRLTRLTAVLTSQITYPPGFSQFHIGNKQSFGHDVRQLAEAVTAYHTNYYQPQNMQLWLCSDRTAQQIARQFARAGITLHTDVNPVAFSLPALADGESLQTAFQDGMISLNGAAGVIVSYLLAGLKTTDLSLLTLLQQLIQDRSPGTFLDYLQQLKPGIRITMHILCHDHQQLWLVIDYQGGQLTAEDTAIFSDWTRQWLLQSASLSSAKLEHYCQLAWQTFSRISLMEQLRQRALQLQPPLPNIQASEWASFVRLLAACQQTSCRLYNKAGSSFTPKDFAGFTVGFQPYSFNAILSARLLPALTFYPEPQPDIRTINYKNQHGALLYHAEQQHDKATLILTPGYAEALSAEMKSTLQQAIQPVFDLLQHEGGKGEWLWRSGNDYLCFSAPGITELVRILQLLIQRWPGHAVASLWLEEQIPVKRLMAILPSLLASHQGAVRWMGLVSGVDKWQQHQIGCYLEQLPVDWLSTARPPWLEKQGKVQEVLLSSDQDPALVAFIPFPPQVASLAAWRRLALIYQQRFYQWLREEHAIGYVVSCCYQRMVDKHGVVIMLQSPQWTAPELQQWSMDFFSMMTDELAGSVDIVLPEPAIVDIRESIDLLIDRIEQIKASICNHHPIEFVCTDPGLVCLHQLMVQQVTAGKVYWLLTRREE